MATIHTVALANISQMKFIYILLFLVHALCANNVCAQVEQGENGIIGRYVEDGLPVIMKFVASFPDVKTRSKFPILTVISWKYNGELTNGMPSNETNAQMIELEDALDVAINESGIFTHAYSRTGNNLKELVYYSTKQDDFNKTINKALLDHSRYPIEIVFYEDNEWSDFMKILSNFKK